MKEYILTVITAAVGAAIADIAAPEGWRKYIRVLVGLLIMSALLAPVGKFKNVRILPLGETAEIDTAPLYDSVSEELRQNVERDIEERIRDEFGAKTSAEAEIDIDGEHRILGVRAIRIICAENPAGLIERLKTVYGCDNVELRFR